MLSEMILLLSAGFFGGVLNSIAGGGSFITFPALLLVGLQPITANATNTFASCAGYLSGAVAFRDNLYSYKAKLPALISISLVGGIVGAWLLLQTPQSLFREAIPWLLLFATALFIFGENINHAIKKMSAVNRHASVLGVVLSSLLLLAVCVYGGFFNAGLGIIALSYLALVGYTDINVMNGMKLLISSMVSLIAIVVFIVNDVIAWYEGGIVLVGSLLGGYMAARISKHLPQRYVRNFVIIASCCVTVYFFSDTY